MTENRFMGFLAAVPFTLTMVTGCAGTPKGALYSESSREPPASAFPDEEESASHDEQESASHHPLGTESTSVVFAKCASKQPESCKLLYEIVSRRPPPNCSREFRPIAGERTIPGRIRRKWKPVYPSKLIAAGVQGEVKVRISIDNCGDVRGSEVVSSSGNELLDQLALKSVNKSYWQSGIGITSSGELLPVDTIFIHSVKFEIDWLE